MDTNKTDENRANWLLHAWQLAVKPHPAIQEVGEQRLAKLAIKVVFAVWLTVLIGFISSLPQDGGYAMAAQDFGLPVIGALLAYALTKTRAYRSGIFLFAFVFSLSMFFGVIREGRDALVPYVLSFIPLSLIVASLFLSTWGILLLVGANIGLLLLLRLFGVTIVGGVMGMTVGIIISMGVVLILQKNFRNQLEGLRLQEARRSQGVEVQNVELEQRVAQRTVELETANRHIMRRASQLQAITKLSEDIAQVRDLGELFRIITHLISEMFGFYHVGVFVVDPEKEFAILQAANSEGGQRMLERGHRLNLGMGVVGYAAQTGFSRIALDVGADAVYFNNPDLPLTKSEAALPLKARGETIGVLDVQSMEANAFSVEDLQVLNALASQVAISFENIRLLMETRAALAQAEEVYNEFTRTEWGRAISAQAGQTGFRYQAGRIEMVEEVLSTPEAVLATATGSVAMKQTKGMPERRATMAVPVKLRGEVIGVLQIESDDPLREWQEDDVSLMQSVAERAAFALENARLFQDARRRASKEQLISESTSRISSALNIENILRTTARELERVLGGSEVLIRFRQDKEQS